jgi:hypothetical protein
MNIPDYKVPDLAEVSARVADGIALGGDYMEVFMQYVQAHHDRAYLLKLLKKECVGCGFINPKDQTEFVRFSDCPIHGYLPYDPAMDHLPVADCFCETCSRYYQRRVPV